MRVAARFVPLRDRLQNWIVTSGGKCGLVQHMSQGSASSDDCAFDSHRSTVVGHGHEAGHGCGFTGGHPTEFRHFAISRAAETASII